MKRTASALTFISILFILLLLIAAVPSLKAVSEAPEAQWEKNYGPLEGYSVVQTSDGGYIIAGMEAVYERASRGPGNWVNHSAVLIKTDVFGSVQWKKNFTESHSGVSVIQTNEGGFVLAGPDKTQELFGLQRLIRMAMLSGAKHSCQEISLWSAG